MAAGTEQAQGVVVAFDFSAVVDEVRARVAGNAGAVSDVALGAQAGGARGAGDALGAEVGARLAVRVDPVVVVTGRARAARGQDSRVGLAEGSDALETGGGGLAQEAFQVGAHDLGAVGRLVPRVNGAEAGIAAARRSQAIRSDAAQTIRCRICTGDTVGTAIYKNRRMVAQLELQ